MGEEQPRPHRAAQRQQVVVAPGRHHLAVHARLVALAVPADAEAVAVGHRLGLFGAQRLVHQRVARLGDQVFEEDRLTQVGYETAHRRPPDRQGFDFPAPDLSLPARERRGLCHSCGPDRRRRP
jgi:hypothetical protein